MLKFGSKGGEISAKLHERAHPEASDEFPVTAHLGAVCGSTKELPSHRKGLFGWDAECAIQLFCEQ